MSNKVKIGLIQASHDVAGEVSVTEHKEAAIAKHLRLIDEAVSQGAKIVCLQEVFYGPYFCAEQTTKWYEAAESIPDGPTIRLMQEVAKKHHIVLIVPIYEREQEGVYYNTAAVIDADGTYLGKYRKHHIPQVQAGDDTSTGFWEKYYFKPGNLGYPVFDTAYARVGVYICYDRHFPEGSRLLGLHGAVVIFNRAPGGLRSCHQWGWLGNTLDHG